MRALEFKAKEAFLARSGLSGQALEAEEMRLMRLREGASLIRRTPAAATPLGAKKAGKRAAEAARRAIALEREVWVDGVPGWACRKGEGDCRPPPFAHLVSPSPTSTPSCRRPRDCASFGTVVYLCRTCVL